MVRAFHAEGMEVILQFYFPKEINREMILEVIRYWVCEYHIDGVHLMGEQIPVGILAADPMLTDTKLIYYGFPYEEIYPVGQVPDVRNLAECRDEFQYDMRRFLKGDEDTLHQALRRMRCNPVQNGVTIISPAMKAFPWRIWFPTTASITRQTGRTIRTEIPTTRAGTAAWKDLPASGQFCSCAKGR